MPLRAQAGARARERMPCATRCLLRNSIMRSMMKLKRASFMCLKRCLERASHAKLCDRGEEAGVLAFGTGRAHGGVVVRGGEGASAGVRMRIMGAGRARTSSAASVFMSSVSASHLAGLTFSAQ